MCEMSTPKTKTLIYSSFLHKAQMSEMWSAAMNLLLEMPAINTFHDTTNPPKTPTLGKAKPNQT